MIDPVVNYKKDEEKKVTAVAGQSGSSGIFGGGEDIFDNEELFRTADGKTINVNKKENEDIDLNQDTDEYHDDDVINGEVVKTDNGGFDPIFTEEDGNQKLKTENNKQESTEEEIVNIEQSNEEDIDMEVKKDIPEAINNPDINSPYIKNDETTITKENENEKDIQVEEDDKIITEEEKIEIEPSEEKSDLMKKFGELVNKTKELYKIAQMEDSEYVELIGGDTGSSQVTYNLRLIKEDEESDSVLISKIESNNETKDEQQNNLEFKNNDGLLEIFLDEQLLYEEEDLKDDQNKKMQVLDKLNKFIFLVSEELKIYERDRKEKDRMEQERRKLRDIFRNF